MSPAELRVPRPNAFIPVEGHYLQQSKIRTCYKYITATKKIIAYQLQEAIEKEHFTKTALATRLETSRAAINRLLDPENESITLLTLKKAANVLGKKLRLELI
jgi:DNA-binding Xre family transcriptional regulator